MSVKGPAEADGNLLIVHMDQPPSTLVASSGLLVSPLACLLMPHVFGWKNLVRTLGATCRTYKLLHVKFPSRKKSEELLGHVIAHERSSKQLVDFLQFAKAAMGGSICPRPPPSCQGSDRGALSLESQCVSPVSRLQHHSWGTSPVTTGFWGKHKQEEKWAAATIYVVEVESGDHWHSSPRRSTRGVRSCRGSSFCAKPRWGGFRDMTLSCGNTQSHPLRGLISFIWFHCAVDVLA